MTTKQVDHFTLDLKVTGVETKPIFKTVKKKKVKNGDVYIYKAKNGDSTFTFTLDTKTVNLHDEVAIDVNITRENSKQTKL